MIVIDLRTDCKRKWIKAEQFYCSYCQQMMYGDNDNWRPWKCPDREEPDNMDACSWLGWLNSIDKTTK